MPRATTKKGFWTLVRTVKVVYTQFDDYDNCDEPLSLKKAKEAADTRLSDVEGSGEGINVELIKGEEWEVEDFEEDE